MNSTALVAAGTTVVGLLGSGCTALSPHQLATYEDGVDTTKVAAINSVARSRGVTVHRAHYPQRRVAARDAMPDVVPTLGEPSGT